MYTGNSSLLQGNHEKIPPAGVGVLALGLEITDSVSKQSISPTAEFTVQEAVASASKN
jgi:hypothetical protein